MSYRLSVSSVSEKLFYYPSTSSKSSARQTPKLSRVVVSSRLFATRVLVCTEVGAGQQLVTRLVLSRYVLRTIETSPPYYFCCNSTNGGLIFFSSSLQLFGGSAFAKEYIFQLQDYNKATWFQNFVASIAGASSSLVVSAPLDVIKTRIQNRNFDNPESGFRILTNMARQEGFSSFFKGLVPKVRRWRRHRKHS